jgi:hypothetical protein
MRIGILGSGLMGGKLGTLFARAGDEVVFSYARSKEKLQRFAREGNASAGTPGEAAKEADAEGRSEMALVDGFCRRAAACGPLALELDRDRDRRRRVEEVVGRQAHHLRQVAERRLAAIGLPVRVGDETDRDDSTSPWRRSSSPRGHRNRFSPMPGTPMRTN